MLGLLLGLNSLESKLYFYLVQNGERTVSQLVKEASRNQSTIHVALQKLVALNLCTKSKRTKRPKGYEFVYTSVNPRKVQQLLLSRLDEIYQNTKICVETFDDQSLSCSLMF